MKNTGTTKSNQQIHQHKKMAKVPENKDNLDSRKNEEQSFKGDDVTHNEKETQYPPKNQDK